MISTEYLKQKMYHHHYTLLITLFILQILDSGCEPHSRTVILECRVRNLGNRAVSWIRQSDLHILTVGETSYTNSLKFFPTHPPGSDEWNLRITNPGLADSGTYECQINTEPKRSRLYHLDVVISKAKIHGDRDVFVQEGSDINLTCTALSTPEQPERVTWRHNNLDLHRSIRGGIAIVTEKRRRTSVLLMYRAVSTDTGNYSCEPSNAESDTVQVHVLEGTGIQLMIKKIKTLGKLISFFKVDSQEPMLWLMNL